MVDEPHSFHDQHAIFATENSLSHARRHRPSHHMPDVGIIGLGPTWESRYLPVLKKLRNRIRVRAVYDPVFCRAQNAAVELEADVSEGIHSLVRRRDLRAVLVLDSNWQSTCAIKSACDSGKAVYLGGKMPLDLPLLDHLHQHLSSQGIEAMAELPWRYVPCTTRLRELMVTRLGPVKSIRISSATGDAQGRMETSIGLIDLCQYLIGTPPRKIETSREGSSHLYRLSFHKSRQSAEAASAEIEMHVSQSDIAKDEDSLLGEIICEHGSARIRNQSELTWRNGTDAGVEVLTADRSEIEVMLDHFCRRVVGALVPVPSLDDTCRVLQWLQEASPKP